MNILDNLNRIEAAKQKIKDAIVSKGIKVSDSDLISSYSDKILKITGDKSDSILVVAERRCNLSVYKANDGNSIREMGFVEDV